MAGNWLKLFPRGARVCVCSTSGYSETAIAHGGQLDPDVVLLRKPYRKSDLVRKIREVLHAPRDRRTLLLRTAGPYIRVKSAGLTGC